MPNLKELRMSVGRIPKFNVGDQLSGTIGLQHLHLVLQTGPNNCDLRQELQGKLPASLQRVTVEASKMPALHPAALKVSYGSTSSSHLCVLHQNVTTTQN